MVFNSQKRFIFLEVPKTGSSAIVKLLLAIDKQSHRNILTLENGLSMAMPTHATYNDVVTALGEDRKLYTIIGFIRDPEDVALSKYYFYKNGRASREAKNRAASVSLRWRVLLSKALPLSIWVLVYPFKPTKRFLHDGEGSLGVDVLGDFSEIESHVEQILTSLGYEKGVIKLTKVNVSKHEKPKLEGIVTRAIFELKIRNDRRFYWNVIDKCIATKTSVEMQ